ncbi:SirB2 family protein [Photobacterium frigidiphilum]|uniref:SirB2 family protein n=1 Tax=Photobacterium frigidiphilum TaxID=264736 RepID=UPI000D159D56|nr:SirB2 family protein [Photobacterium frigidiphilum]
MILTILVSSLILCFLSSQYPFVDTWLTEKLVLLVAYVDFAMLDEKFILFRHSE